MTPSILIVEDDDDIRTYLDEILKEHQFKVHLSAKGTNAIQKVEKIQPDLVLLDLFLPDVSGESLCKEIKKHFPHIPVIILTAKDSSSDMINGLNIGADDYITKPFDAAVLIARIKARLRSAGKMSGKLQVSDLILDANSMEVHRAKKLIALTAQEFKILEYLMNNKNKVLSRDMILNRIWLSSPDVETRVVDVYIGYLRKKIEGKGLKKLIFSVRGFGYMMKDTQ